MSGPVALVPPAGVRLIEVETAEEMRRAVRDEAAGADVVVMAAAVADWRPKKAAPLKLKKSAGPPRFEWEATPDILSAIAPLKKKTQVFCGFAAETHRVASEARRKLRDKNLDAIAANDVSKKGRGFESDRNALTIYFPAGRPRRIALAPKIECAERLLGILAEIFAQKKSENILKNN